jgi:hypothetical protein
MRTGVDAVYTCAEANGCSQHGMAFPYGGKYTDGRSPIIESAQQTVERHFRGPSLHHSRLLLLLLLLFLLLLPLLIIMTSSWHHCHTPSWSESSLGVTR